MLQPPKCASGSVNGASFNVVCTYQCTYTASAPPPSSTRVHPQVVVAAMSRPWTAALALRSCVECRSTGHGAIGIRGGQRRRVHRRERHPRWRRGVAFGVAARRATASRTAPRRTGFTINESRRARFRPLQRPGREWGGGFPGSWDRGQVAS